MSEHGNQELEKELDRQTRYRLSDAQMERVTLVETRITTDQELLDTMTNYFNDMTLVEMLDESRKRWAIYTEPRPRGDWKSTFRSSNPRNQLLRIVANLTVKYLDPQFKITGKEQDKMQLQFIKDIFVATEQMHDGDLKQLLAALALCIDGTAVRYLGYAYEQKEVRELDDYTGDYDEATWKEKTITRWFPIDELVPVEEMLFANPFERSVQKQTHLTHVTSMPLATFRSSALYKRYDNTEKVRPLKYLSRQERSFYQRYDDREDSVVVFSHYDKEHDHFDLIASGVPLTKPKMPIPFIGVGKDAGKAYPFATGQFEPELSSIYGKGLMFKLRGEDGYISAIYRMIIDREFLSLRAPLIISGQNVSDTADWEIAPDQLFEVEGDGEIKTLPLQPADQQSFQVLNKLERGAESSGAPTQTLGVTQNAPATNAALAERNARELWGVFAKSYAYFNREVNRLKLANILLYAMNPVTIVQTLGPKGLDKYEEVFGTFNLEGVRLSDNTIGTRSISVRPSPFEILSRSDLDLKELLARKKGENVEYNEITPDYIRNVEIDAKLGAVDVTGESDNSEKILFTALLDKAQQYFPDLMDRQAWFRNMLEMNKQDADELTRKAGVPMPSPPMPGSPSPLGANGMPMNESAMSGKVGRLVPQAGIAPMLRQLAGV